MTKQELLAYLKQIRLDLITENCYNGSLDISIKELEEFLNISPSL